MWWLSRDWNKEKLVWFRPEWWTKPAMVVADGWGVDVYLKWFGGDTSITKIISLLHAERCDFHSVPYFIIFRPFWPLLPAPNIYCVCFYLQTLFFSLLLLLLFTERHCVRVYKFNKFHSMFFSHCIRSFSVRLLSSGDDWCASIVVYFGTANSWIPIYMSILRMFFGCSQRNAFKFSKCSLKYQHHSQREISFSHHHSGVLLAIDLANWMTVEPIETTSTLTCINLKQFMLIRIELFSFSCLLQIKTLKVPRNRVHYVALTPLLFYMHFQL